MAVICPACGRQHDIALFQFGRTVRCACGALIDEAHVEPFRGIGRILEELDDREAAAEIRRMADGVCRMILDPSAAEVDIEIAVERVRDRCAALFPGRLGLFEMIYESRFRRLRGQFRGEG